MLLGDRDKQVALTGSARATLNIWCAVETLCGRLRFFTDLVHLAERDAFAAYLAPLRKIEWVVYAKRPFAGPEAVLAYLSRFSPRVEISN